MYEVKDGARTLRFKGVKLATSSSRHRESTRWIEFALFRTDGGTYVLHRVGVSLIYHTSVCPLVKRYGLHEVSNTDLLPTSVPCEDCSPTEYDPMVYPETYRYWTLTSDDAGAVVDALYKDDSANPGTRYLTRVAERLLEQASEHDPELDAAYRIEFIP